MDLNLIVAYARNRVIGRDNTLPWKLPGDMAHFRRTTMGNPIIMGRKTWDSLGRPLPGRRNIVISADKSRVAEGADFVQSLPEALELIASAPRAFVIGGAQVYRQALALADGIVATEIGIDVDGDAFFDPIDPVDWVEVSRSPQPVENGLPYDLVHYRRRNASIPRESTVNP